MDRVLARIHLADEMKRIEQERRNVDQRLRRLGKAYVDGLYGDDDYKREKRSLEDRAAALVIPGIDVAMEAGKLLESLPALWNEADLTERRNPLDLDAGRRLRGNCGGKDDRGYQAEVGVQAPLRDRQHP